MQRGCGDTIPANRLRDESRSSLRDVPGVSAKCVPLNAAPLCANESAKFHVYKGEVTELNSEKLIHPWVLDGFLTSYQQEAWEWSRTRSSSLLYWACGSGKTLAALLWLSEGGPDERKLVITRAPARRQWQREVSHYTSLQAKVLTGQTPSPIGDEELVIVSWETVKYWREAIEEWVGRHPFSLVFDEIHKGKNWKRTEKVVGKTGRIRRVPADNRAAAVASLSRTATRRLGLTATVIRDRVSDLWAQLDLIEPDCWGSSWTWLHRYCDARQGSYGGLDTSGRSNIAELKQRMSTMTHVVQREQLARSLPPKRRQLVYLHKEDQSRPVGFAEDMKRAAKRGRQALFEMKLLEASSRKRKWIVETAVDAVEAGQKVCIMTGRRADCERIAKDMRKKLQACDTPVWSGHGGDPTTYRDKIVQDYAEHTRAGVFVGTTDAFGEAVDGLQNTDLAIVGLLPWTPGSLTQLEGRFSRHGSKRNVLIIYTIAAGTVDEHVCDLVLSKMEAVADALDCSESGELANTLSGADDEEEILNSILAMSF